MNPSVTIPKKTLAASLLLKCIVVLCAAAGTAVSALAPGLVFMGGRVVFMYFTIQSNIVIALICAVGAVLLLRRAPIGSAWLAVKFMGTVAITLTGTVFCFILAPTMGRAAWNMQNVLTHAVVPIAAIADFFTTGVYGRLRKRCALLALLPPLAYAVYAGIGFAHNWNFGMGRNYPYFFLNWGSPAGAFGFCDGLPYMGCGWWVLALMVLLLGIGHLYLSALSDHRKRVLKTDT